MTGNNVSKRMKLLTERCDNEFEDCVVLIHNESNKPYNFISISVEGKDKDEVSKRAMHMSRKIRTFREFTKDSRLTVERKTLRESTFEVYEITIMMDNDGV